MNGTAQLADEEARLPRSRDARAASARWPAFGARAAASAIRSATASHSSTRPTNGRRTGATSPTWSKRSTRRPPSLPTTISTAAGASPPRPVPACSRGCSTTSARGCRARGRLRHRADDQLPRHDLGPARHRRRSLHEFAAPRPRLSLDRFGVANAEFVQMNLFRPPFADGVFDVVISQRRAAPHRRSGSRLPRARRQGQAGGHIVVGLYNWLAGCRRSGADVPSSCSAPAWPRSTGGCAATR